MAAVAALHEEERRPADELADGAVGGALVVAGEEVEDVVEGPQGQTPPSRLYFLVRARGLIGKGVLPTKLLDPRMHPARPDRHYQILDAHESHTIGHGRRKQAKQDREL